MTELEKQEILRNFGVVIDYLTQQRNTEQTSIVQNNLLYNITSAPADGLSIPAIPFPFAAPSTISDWDTQISHLTQTADYIKHTEAAALTDVSIHSFAQALR